MRAWLIENAFESNRVEVVLNKGWIEVSVTIGEAELLLQTDYNIYSQITGKERLVCDSYHLRSHIAPHADLATPTVHFDARFTRCYESSDGQPSRGIGSP